MQESSFVLHNDFLQKKQIYNTPTTIALLENNLHNPWIILVPKIAGAVELIDLSHSQQLHILEEINKISHIFKAHFGAEKLNIATLGNVTPQLHFHIITRYKSPQKDRHFPKPLFGLECEKMDETSYTNRVKEILKYL